jgi:hypothetical protein
VANDQRLRKQLVKLLRSQEAHAGFDKSVAGMPVAKVGLRPEGLPHSAWELLEHMRIAQDDILRFSRSSDYQSIRWPEAYWPRSPQPKAAGDWAKSIAAFRKDLAEFERLVQDPARDLYEPFPWGDGQTLLREALLLADHNAYHVGQLVLVRRLLGEWS